MDFATTVLLSQGNIFMSCSNSDNKNSINLALIRNCQMSDMMSNNFIKWEIGSAISAHLGQESKCKRW